MKIVLWANGERGAACTRALLENKLDVALVILHAADESVWHESIAQIARERRIPIIAPEDPNAPEVETQIRGLAPDVFVLAGYGKILASRLLGIPRTLSVNLHAGKLPEYRGSSPMNWALIKGEASFTLSVLAVDAGVDSGDILLEKTFPIKPDDTIRELHKIASAEFPVMLLQVLAAVRAGKVERRPQDPQKFSYYPLRFPDDGFVLWDMQTAEKIHNQIRALTKPYPCAFTFLNGKKVLLVSSRLTGQDFFGEPGRIYRIKTSGLLIAAQDKCLWITEAFFEETGRPLAEEVKRYDSLLTVKGAVLQGLKERVT